MQDPKDQDRVNREMRVMRHVAGHACIAELLECVETPDYLYIIMEHCAGGSLLDNVREKKRLTEAEAAVILQQILYSLQYCHAKGVVHRDVKLENILMDGDGAVRLIDFGLSGYFSPGKKLKCFCGSPSYAAPEIVTRQEYDAPLVDVWSLGVVLFAMLAGHLPFYSKEKKDLSKKIAAGACKIPSSISSAGRDLISKMLSVDPQKRITLDQIWFHTWMDKQPQWKPTSLGPGGLLRHEIDDVGTIIPDIQILQRLRQGGMDVNAISRAVVAKERTSLTVAYHLLMSCKANFNLTSNVAMERSFSGGSYDSDQTTTSM